MMDIQATLALIGLVVLVAVSLFWCALILCGKWDAFRDWATLTKTRDFWGDRVMWKHLKEGDRNALHSFINDRCDCCGRKHLLAGPQGPGAQNYLCGACGAKWNYLVGMEVKLLRGPVDPIPELENRPATHTEVRNRADAAEGIRLHVCKSCRGAGKVSVPNVGAVVGGEFIDMDCLDCLPEPEPVPPPRISRRQAVMATRNKYASRG